MISPVDTLTARSAGLGGSPGAEALRRWQLGKLCETLEYARARGRFYAERLGALDPLAEASLEELPFTLPSDLARDPLAFLCLGQAEVARVATLASSGTSGSRKRVFFSEGDLARTVDFFEQGMAELVDPGQAALILMSGGTENSVGRLLEAALARLGVGSRIGQGLRGLADALEAARGADCIVGLPADLVRLCRSDGSLRPRSVLLSADYVPLSALRAIEEAWHCEVFTHYGMTETAYGLAVQCASREGHHLRGSEFLVEIVDPESGQPLGPGELGEIVLSALRSEAMPLIRYRTGDLARMLSGPCACGGELPRLGRVEGRRENLIGLRGGGRLSIHELDELLFGIPSVRGFQAALRLVAGRERLVLTLDSSSAVDPDALRTLPLEDGQLELRYARLEPFTGGAKRRILIERGD